MKDTLHFCKYEAAGNDFIVIDGRQNHDLLDFARQNGKKLCDRHFGIGADGVLIITDKITDEKADAAMHIVNADGSIAAMCGNGIRCIARYLYETGKFDPASDIYIDTLGGLQCIRCHQNDTSQITVSIARVEIGTPIQIEHKNELYTGMTVDVGNPHAVFEVRESPETSLERSGNYLSNHEIFPDRSNIEFIREIADNEIDLAVYERGVGPTLACGTGCTAAAAAYGTRRHLTGCTIKIHAPGGDLSVYIPKNANEKYQLSGPAQHVFDGIWPID